MKLETFSLVVPRLLRNMYTYPICCSVGCYSFLGVIVIVRCVPGYSEVGHIYFSGPQIVM